MDISTLRELAPGALAIMLVGCAEALGAAKAAASQSGGDIDPNQELGAHGPANVLSGLFGGFLVVRDSVRDDMKRAGIDAIVDQAISLSRPQMRARLATARRFACCLTSSSNAH